MTNPDFDSSIVRETSHRPWPMPSVPWVMSQTWHDLLFAHWPVDPDALRERLPKGLELDLFDGQAWLGVVPFCMTNVGPRGLPNLPWVSEFPELNVRTYVRAGDRPGVYFFSLDAASRVAVSAARVVLNLPYWWARMHVATNGNGGINYRSERGSRPEFQFHATYTPRGEIFSPAAGTLEYFLTERYCLYNQNHAGELYSLDIHHRPWRLQSAQATFHVNTMERAAGLDGLVEPALLHFARRQDVVVWGPGDVRRVAQERTSEAVAADAVARSDR